MNEPTKHPSATRTGLLDSGTLLHVWLKAMIPGKAARLALSLDGREVASAETDNIEEFAFRVLDATAGGTAILTWDPQTTSLSVVYAFRPDTVMASGITLLTHNETNAPPSPSPLYHFVPPFGWMNDPNGFGRFGGKPHLFYQHYPHSKRWNNMHWGHAVSDDFLRWRHLPVFLFPSEDISQRPDGRGGAYSGSAIAAEDGAIRVFFTDKMENREPEEQNQWTAVSADAIAAAPADLIVPRRPEGLNLTRDFRDPYVFRGPDGLWKMLLGSRDREGGVVLLYETADPTGAKDWHFVGILSRENRFGMKAAECPCLVPLGHAGHSETRWALIVGLLTSRCAETGRRNLTTATVGRFDGRNFTPEFEQELDFGTDAYAFQAFADGIDAVSFAWLANWADISKNIDYQSAATLPRRLVLRGEFLCTPPVHSVTSLRSGMLDTQVLQDGGRIDLGDGAVEILLELTAPGSTFKIDFEHPDLELGVEQNADGLAILYQATTDRTSPRYLARGARAKSLRIFLDRGSIEVFADDGRWTGTKRLRTFAPVRAGRIAAGIENLAAATAWQLRL
ncbi:MAG: glycoside hydrolase family 32 protein [Mesorhizobium sp.]|uniref:GH32 C-terminal domain-containing protein n=1 Tax=Mesorhizobium sp. TaxID=1871066 RepID=UPI000FEA6778|nr:GH32 C-terminal domain-containing protein [Mesorhizobium sp.]RWC92567.1 MAG: glycoside hydrolase family 32 protein [Mesorhizobium sp.]